MDDTNTEKLLRSKLLIATVLREHREDLEIMNTSAKTTLQDLLKTAKAEEMRAGELARYNTKQRSSATKGGKLIDSDPSVFLLSLRNELGQKRSSEPSREAKQQREDSPHTEAATLSVGDAMDTDEQNQRDTADVAMGKKARTVNISFGMSDSEESDDDDE